MLAASGGGSAAAGTRFYACVVGESRTLNLVTKNARCPRHATKISWSASGAAGPRGLPGATGDAGAAGAGGPAGPVEAAGAAGNQGAAGVVGSPGTPGPKGDTGTPGAKGDAGNPGAKGDTGETGPAGGTMLIGGGPVTISSALGGLPLATTLLPVSGRLGSGNTTSYPPSSIDPAVMAAAQVMSTDITITGFRFVYTNTVTAFTLNTPVISVTLYAGQPGGALSSTSVGCSMTGTSPMSLGVALTCHGDASLVVSAGTMLYLGVVSTTNESTTLSGQVATGLTTN